MKHQNANRKINLYIHEENGSDIHIGWVIRQYVGEDCSSLEYIVEVFNYGRVMTSEIVGAAEFLNEVCRDFYGELIAKF